MEVSDRLNEIHWFIPLSDVDYVKDVFDVALKQ